LPSEKELQFDRLWDGETPSGRNETKAMQFRQKMKMALIQKGVPFTRENAKLYWMGQLKAGDRLAEEEREYRERRAVQQTEGKR